MKGAGHPQDVVKIFSPDSHIIAVSPGEGFRAMSHYTVDERVDNVHKNKRAARAALLDSAKDWCVLHKGTMPI